MQLSKNSSSKIFRTQSFTPRFVSKRKSLKDSENEYSGLQSFSSNTPTKEKPINHQKYNDFVPLYSKKKADLEPDEDEYTIQQRNKAPRPINVDNLSPKQKEMYKMSVFEKDLVRIKEKKKQIEEYEKETIREVDDFLTPPKRDKNRPKLDLMELAKPRQRKPYKPPKLTVEKIPESQIEPISEDLYKQLNKHITPEEIAEYQEQYYEQISQRLYFGTEQKREEFDEEGNQYYYNEEDLKRLKEENEEKFAENVKSTRSTQLKTNINRLKVLKMDVEERHEIVNAAMRLKAQQQAQKRLHDRPNKQRPIDNPEKSMRDKKTELRNNYENYVETLGNIQLTTDKSQTLLERIEYDSLTQYK